MATEQIRESLEKASASLRRATAELIEMRCAAPRWNQSLEQALRNLRTAVQDPAFETSRESLRMLVQSVRTEVVRIQALLDAAAAFYCGWSSATPAGPGTYAPDGELQREGGSGRLMLNA